MSRQLILVSGFEPYGGYTCNPSGEMASGLGQEQNVRALVLPVSYAQAEVMLLQCITELKPKAVLLLGMWQGSSLKLERLALNLDDSGQADESGEVRTGRKIDPQGPVGYWSSLPLEAMARVFTRNRLPHEWSRDAGGFVCNHCFYLAAREMSRQAPPAPCGLIHVPAPDRLSVELQLNALHACLKHM